MVLRTAAFARYADLIGLLLAFILVLAMLLRADMPAVSDHERVGIAAVHSVA